MKVGVLSFLTLLALIITLFAPVLSLRLTSSSINGNLALGSRKEGRGKYPASSLSVGDDAAAALMINVDQKKNISSTLYGIFFEEIGHAGDGGLYTELVQDRSFEATAAAAGFQRLGQSEPSKLKVDLRSLTAFHRGPMEPISYLADEKQNQGLNFTGQSRRPPDKKAVEEGNAIIIPWVALAGTSTTLTREVPLNAGNPVAMELSVDQPGEQGEVRRGGLANFGYWGVHVEKGKSYTYSLYVRNPQDDAVKMDVSLASADFGQRYATASFSARPGGAWKRYSGELTTDVADTDARVLVTFEGPATVIIDSVSLFATENVEKGKRLGHVNPWPFRADLLQALKDLRPG